MAILFYLKSRLYRGLAGGLSILVVLAALGWFSCEMLHFVDRKAMEMEEAYDSIPVTVVISNLKGTQTDGLKLNDYIVDYFISDRYTYGGQEQSVAFSFYLKNVRIKTTLYYDSDAKYTLSGITDLGAVSLFDAITGITIDYFDTWDETVFRGGEPLCLVSQGKLAELSPEEDGLYRLALYVRTAPASNEKTMVELIVAGTYSGEGDAIYCPWKVVTGCLDELGERIFADSISVDIADNRALEEFRPILARHFTQVDPVGHPVEMPNGGINRYYSFAATIHDETLRQTLNELNRNLQLLRLLLPLVLVLELAAAFAACFFYVQTRKKELAMARSLGTRRWEVLVMLLLELLLWCILGSALGLGIFSLTASGSVSRWGIAGIDLAAVAGALSAGVAVTGRKGMRSIKEAE